MDNLVAYKQALALLSENRFDEAYSLFSQCLGIEEISQPDLLFNCGWCLENIGIKRNQVLKYYLSSYESAQRDELRLNAGFRYSWLLINDKNYTKALPFLSKIQAETKIALNESLLLRHATYWLAVCLEHEGKFLAAIDFYSKFDQFNNESLALEARYRKIICLNQVGKLESALQCADEFLSISALPDIEEIRQTELAKLVLIEKSQIERALAEA